MNKLGPSTSCELGLIKTTTENLKVYYLNVRSIRLTKTNRRTKIEKLNKIKKTLEEDHPDVICLTETHQIEGEDNDALNLRESYHIIRQPRTELNDKGSVKEGGGVLIGFSKKRIDVKSVSVVSQKSFATKNGGKNAEYIIVILKIPNGNSVVFGVVYDPTKGLHDNFRLEVDRLLGQIENDVPADTMRCIVGDFNWGTMIYNELGCPQWAPCEVFNCFELNSQGNFKDCSPHFVSLKKPSDARAQQATYQIFTKHKLENVNKCATRIDRGGKISILDIILTNKAERIVNVSDKGVTSDHKAFMFEILNADKPEHIVNTSDKGVASDHKAFMFERLNSSDQTTNKAGGVVGIFILYAIIIIAFAVIFIFIGFSRAKHVAHNLPNGFYCFNNHY